MDFLIRDFMRICDASYPKSWYEPIPRQAAPQSSAMILY